MIDFDDLVRDAEEVESRPDARAIEETLLTGLLQVAMAPRILELTRPADYHFSLHRDFAQVVYSLLQEGRFVDLVIFRNRADQLDALGKDGDKLLDLAAHIIDKAATSAPPVGKVEAYLDLFVADALRRLAKTTVEKVRVALDKGDLTPEQASAAILRVASDLNVGGRLAGAAKTEGEDLEPFFASLEARQSPGNDYQGLDTGFDHLNRVINGLGAGLVVLAASPSTGKTTLAKQIVDYVVEHYSDVAALFVSLEQSKEELRVKTLSRLSGIENRDLQRGRLDTSAPAWAKVVGAKETLKGFADRLLILEGDRLTTVDRIRLAAIQLRQKTEASRLLIVVDYLQILPVDDGFSDIRQKVNFVTSELRRIGRDLDCPVIAISSINRASYDTKSPRLDVFKESGDIEFSADVALVMTEPAKDKKETGESNYLGVSRKWKMVFLDVVKNRNGEKARIRLEFYPEVSRFREVDRGELSEV